MKTVYLISGPRGSGKSSYCRRVAALDSKLKLVIRDDVLMELFGETSLSPYEGGHLYAQEIVFEMVEKFLSGSGNTGIVLDSWNGFSDERTAMIKRLKKIGADKVFCWQFRVTEETCVRWFFQKPDSKGYSKSGIKNDYALYYEMAKEIETDGFDGVFQINPLQPINMSLIIQ